MPSTHVAGVPLPPAMSGTVDPVLKLLTAFPVPQLLSTSAPLPETTTTSSSSPLKNSSVASGETETSEDDITQATLEAARTLMVSSSYMSLCRSAGDNGGGNSNYSMDKLSPLAQRIHKGLKEMEEEYLSGIGNMKSIDVSSRNERWSHNTEQNMTLRPRTNLCSDRRSDIKEDVKKIKKIEQNLTHLPSVAIHKEELERAQQKTEMCCLLNVSSVIEGGLKDSNSLESLLGMLSSTAQPFKDISADHLTSFISSLVVPSSTDEKDISTAVMKQAVACCACISHPSFELSILPEDIIDNLITILAGVLRRVAKRLSGRLQNNSNSNNNSNSAVNSSNNNTDLETLRAMLDSFTVSVTEMRLDVCVHGDLLRLEDLCFQCLFVINNNCGRQEATNYAAYVISHAVDLYRCIWNRLEIQRDTVWTSFFSRLPLGENLLLRLYMLPSAVKVMPLTAAVVAAAQSIPISSNVITKSAVDRFQQQCQVWSTMFFKHFLLEERTEKKERDLCSTIVLQFCEDLAHMLGLPEYPVADMLLRSLLVSFMQCCFRSSTAENDYSSLVQGLRPVFVDAVFRVSYVIFGVTHNKLQVSNIPDHCVLSAAQLNEWRKLTLSEKNNSGEEESHISGEEMKRALVYLALSRPISDPAIKNAASLFHIRAAHIFTWALRNDNLPDTALDPLVRTKHVADGGLTLDWDTVNACSMQLCADSDNSLLSPMAKERLPAWLLSVFQVRDDQHTTGLEAARKKTLTHVAKLTALYPPLLEKIWPIARRCVREDNARVREGIIPLLLTLFTETCRNSANTAHVEETATDVITSLLHLLSDRSVTVVTRAIAALDTLLTDTPFRSLLENLSVGEQLLTFTESKLLAMMGPTRESRHQSDVVRLFLRRWVGQEPTDIAAHHTHTQVARELTRLILTHMSYPYEVTESLHLVTLLIGMHRMVSARDAAGKRTTRHHNIVDSQELRGVLIGVAKVLWAEHQRLTPAPQAAASLAAIHALAIACSEWVVPLLEVLAEALVQPLPVGAAEREAAGITLLHVCRILRRVLMAPRPPPVSLDQLARALTALLSKYVGPHQQHILLSASGVLTAAITCGTDRLSNNVNTKYLTLCYSLMNAYYVRTISLLGSLRTDPQSVAYTLRFLFLLSEFLRLYPGWKHQHPELTEETAVSGSGVPNQLARGDGICANVYTVVEQVLQQSPDESQKKTAVIVLRVLASLCMLQPTVFLYRCEPYLRRALDSTADISLQLQGLVLIRDFLKDEDARIDYAASMNAPVPPTTTTAASSSSPPQLTPLPSSLPNERKRRRREELKVVATPCVEEQNSGMATWVMQQFHGEVLQLCESSSVAVRQLAFEVLQLCAQGGLLPPSKYASALVVIAADPQNDTMRQAAIECLSGHSERYPDIIAANAATGVIRTFELHDVCGLDVLRSALVTDSGLQAEKCVHAHLFTSLRKRHRDAILSSILRCFHQEGRARQWLQDHCNSKSSRTDDPEELTRNPFPFLAHLSFIVAYIPYTVESDVLHVLNSCRAALDMIGQSCLDFVEAWRSILRSKKSHQRGSGRNSTKHLEIFDISVQWWKCFGILCISHICTFLRTEYGLNAAKLRRLVIRRSTASHHTTNLPRPEPHSAASQAFQQRIAALVQKATPLWESNAEPASRVAAVEEMHAALTVVVLQEAAVREEEEEKEKDTLLQSEGNSSGKKKRPRGSKGTPKDKTTEMEEQREPQEQQRVKRKQGSRRVAKKVFNRSSSSNSSNSSSNGRRSKSSSSSYSSSSSSSSCGGGRHVHHSSSGGSTDGSDAE
ncbi:Sister chromatid cohesion C-terminal domain [Trypanosoma melophagium]|uniref:Sister chromatid cohesion C-terminal domain n=1 Tax=Trypanosoma melophagium TaxID=715481 RepID=UPI00351AAC3E|nr:Sister chromatid cohesion C-terminal domain [Trypanosoma melophagium]